MGKYDGYGFDPTAKPATNATSPSGYSGEGQPWGTRVSPYGHIQMMRSGSPALALQNAGGAPTTAAFDPYAAHRVATTQANAAFRKLDASHDAFLAASSAPAPPWAGQGQAALAARGPSQGERSAFASTFNAMQPGGPTPASNVLARMGPANPAGRPLPSPTDPSYAAFASQGQAPKSAPRMATAPAARIAVARRAPEAVAPAAFPGGGVGPGVAGVDPTLARPQAPVSPTQALAMRLPSQQAAPGQTPRLAQDTSFWQKSWAVAKVAPRPKAAPQGNTPGAAAVGPLTPLERGIVSHYDNAYGPGMGALALHSHRQGEAEAAQAQALRAAEIAKLKNDTVPLNAQAYMAALQNPNGGGREAAAAAAHDIKAMASAPQTLTGEVRPARGVGPANSPASAPGPRPSPAAPTTFPAFTSGNGSAYLDVNAPGIAALLSGADSFDAAAKALRGAGFPGYDDPGSPVGQATLAALRGKFGAEMQGLRAVPPPTPFMEGLSWPARVAANLGGDPVPAHQDRATSLALLARLTGQAAAPPLPPDPTWAEKFLHSTGHLLDRSGVPAFQIPLPWGPLAVSTPTPESDPLAAGLARPGSRVPF